jgi:hypothetical protein
MAAEIGTPAAAEQSRAQRWLAAIPGTQAYQRRLAQLVELRTLRHLVWFDELPADDLDDATRARLRPEVETLLAGEAEVYVRRSELFDALATPWLFVPAMMAGIFGQIYYGVDQPLGTFALVVLLFGVMIGLKLLANASYAINPESEVLYWLLVSLRILRRRPQDWRDLSARRALLRRLERIAQHIERDLPTRLLSGDGATDAWMRDSARSIADGVRRWKPAVLTPRADSRAWLIGRLRHALLCVASGDWDALRPAERTPLGRPVGLRRSLLEGLLAFATGIALPVLLLVGAQRLDLLKDAGTSATLQLGVAVWILVTANVAFNPYFAPALAALKDLKGLVPGGGKKE